MAGREAFLNLTASRPSKLFWSVASRSFLRNIALLVVPRSQDWCGGTRWTGRCSTRTDGREAVLAKILTELSVFGKVPGVDAKSIDDDDAGNAAGIARIFSGNAGTSMMINDRCKKLGVLRDDSVIFAGGEVLREAAWTKAVPKGSRKNGRTGRW